MEEKKEKTPSPFEEGERLEDKDLQSNGIMQNGLEDGGFRSVEMLFKYQNNQQNLQIWDMDADISNCQLLS